MKVDHPPLFVSSKLSASSFAMPSRPMKRSRSRSRDGQVDRPLKRVSLVNSADVFPQRPIFHTVLPVMDFSHQKSQVSPAEGYSMTPLWRPRPQNDTTAQPPPSYENQVDDDVRMDCDIAPRQSASPGVPIPPFNNPGPNLPDPINAEGVSPRIPKPLMSTPSLEMSEIFPPVSQGSTPQTIRLSQPKRPRFTMGPRSDCEKCRAGVKGHWGHFT